MTISVIILKTWVIVVLRYSQISAQFFEDKKELFTIKCRRHHRFCGALSQKQSVWPEHHGPKTPTQSPKTPTQNTTQKPKKTPLFG